jgi:predicted dehydrogenase
MAAMLDTEVVEAVAIADPAREMIAEAVKFAPNAAVVTGLDELLGLNLDGIVIATPSALHADQSIAALEAGVAVFCQKPLGRNAAEAARVVAAARTANRLLGVDFSYRHTAAMQAIAPLVQGGALGRIQAVDLVFHNAYGPGKTWFYDRAQSGGGCVMDLGVHLVDLALWCLSYPDIGDVSAQLFAEGEPMRTGSDAVEDLALATIRLGSTAVRLACSWQLHAGREAEIAATFYGTQGAVRLANVGGSFYDFTAERFDGTASTTLVSPPDEWGGRAAAAWAKRLAQDPGFDPEAERLVTVSRLIDSIYLAGERG